MCRADKVHVGGALVAFGRARCQIAAIQEAFAVTLSDTFMAHLAESTAELDEYTAQRKKLESRRLAYDAAASRAAKAKKEKDKDKDKDKERREADEELSRAKSRYDETFADVDARARAIRDNERAHVAKLTEFLKLEMNFVAQYMDVLGQAKAEWSDECVVIIYLFRPFSPC